MSKDQFKEYMELFWAETSLHERLTYQWLAALERWVIQQHNIEYDKVHPKESKS